MINTLQQRAYDHIRKSLLLGELAPGSRLSERALAEQIGMSRTPVREAISKLRSDGLLDHVDGVGTFTRVPDRNQIEELYELRIWLEGGAMPRVVQNIQETTLLELDRLCAAMRAVVSELSNTTLPNSDPDLVYRWLMADTAFHITLLRAAGNRTAVKVFCDLRLMSQVLFHHQYYYNDKAVLQCSIDDHEAILEATRARDTSRATEALAQHIRRGLSYSLKAREARLQEEHSGEASSPGSSDALQQVIHDIESEWENRALD